MTKAENEPLVKDQWQRLFAELDESVLAAERTGWISEEEADKLIDEMIHSASV